MISFKLTTKWEGEKVKKKMDDTTFKTIAHAAASIRLIAKRSIKRGKRAGQPGTPPRTQTSRLPRSIVYFVDRKRMYAIVGTSASLIGEVGKAHEFGGQFRKEKYPARPFMAPALEKAAPRLPSDWAASFNT